MKKIILFLMLLSLDEMVISQVNNSDNSKLLKNEINQINNSESFLQFLINHAATYNDFDSLFSIIEGSPCPENFTYNLVNGDNSKSVKVSNGFLHLVGRNFLRVPFNIDQSQIKSIEELLPILYGEIKDPQTNFFNAYKKISADIENKILFNVDSFEVKTGLLYYDQIKYSFVKSNLQSWGKKLNFRDKNLFKFNENNDLPIKNKLVVYNISENCIWENKFWNKINNQDEQFLKNDMGGSIIAENISRYISAQVFNDILFFKVNGKLVWIDVSP